MRLSLFTAGLLSLGFAVAGCTESTTPTPPGGTGGMVSGTGGSGTGGMAGGTGGMGVDMGAPAPTFAEVSTILNGRFCTGCHSGTGAMLPGIFKVNDHAALLADSIQCTGAMARKRVKPGDAANSYIIHKLRNTMLCAGVRMPMGTNPMPESEIMTIEAWINAGAKM